MRPDTEKNKNPVVAYHFRSTFLVLLILVPLISLSFFLMGKQYLLQIEHEAKTLETQFKERVDRLDMLLGTVTNRVKEMQLVARDKLIEAKSIAAITQDQMLTPIKDSPDGSYFHLDDRPLPVHKTMGNLTGIGSITNRNPDLYQEIHMAFNLFPYFRATMQTIRSNAWAYYISARNFEAIYPWVSSAEFRFTTDNYNFPYYQMATPENNPDRRQFWTDVYVDDYGKGLMTTCGIPIYDGDTFLGVINLDLTVNFLNAETRKLDLRNGQLFIINAKNQVVGHPGQASFDQKTIHTLDEVLPKELIDNNFKADLWPVDQISTSGAYAIIRGRMQNAPWQVVFFEPIPGFFESFFHRVGIKAAILFGFIIVLIIASFILNHKNFILPTARFIEYILSRSSGNRVDITDKLPRFWQSWYAAVDRTFNENEKLTRKVQEQNAALEKSVKARTAELTETNLQLNREIEERKRSEVVLRQSDQRFRELFDNMASGMAIYDSPDNGRNFVFKDLNQAGLTAARKKKEDVVGRSVRDVFPGVESLGLFDVFKRVWKTGNPEHHPMSTYKDDNLVLWVENYVCKLPSGELVAIYEDTTARRQAEQARKKLEKQIQQSQKMESIGDLAGGIAHDFNNILFPIMGRSEMLMEDLPPGSSEHEGAVEIHKAARRARDLIKQILTFSRRAEREKHPIRIQQVLTEVIKLMRATIPSNIEITHDIQHDCGQILADPAQMHQIAMNIMTNAYHAVEQAGGRISLFLKETQLSGNDWPNSSLAPGKYAMMQISDTGCGIEPAVINKIFEPYFTTKAQGKGTGLGLAVVYGIAKDHGGDIRVTSEPGKGTRFDIYLPLIGKSAAPAKPNRMAALERGTETVLLVDDEETVVRLEKHILERLGYQVTCRTGSVEALETFRATPDAFDLVITDMTMPKMTGDQLAQEMMAIKPDIPIIICTGFSNKIDAEKARSIGVNGFLIKPIVRSDMAHTVREVLDRGSERKKT